MSGTPKFKIYREGEYVAACKYAEDAAAIVGVSGGLVKYDHGRVIWREGEELIEASQSYDEAGAIMVKRVTDYAQKRKAVQQERARLMTPSKDQWITDEERIVEACAGGELSEKEAIEDLVALGYTANEAAETIVRELG